MHERLRDGPAARLRAQAEIRTIAGTIEADLGSSPRQVGFDGQSLTPWLRWDRSYGRCSAHQHRAQTRPEPLVPCVTPLHCLSHAPGAGCKEPLAVCPLLKQVGQVLLHVDREEIG